jgi:putative endonuclease
VINRIATKVTGGVGEDTAAGFLKASGYRILDRNYRGERYEIDIIAEQGDTIVFCEVKTACGDSFGPATGWVTAAKTRRIAKAAEEYISAHEISGRSFRFDVIGVTYTNGRYLIDHIVDAFSAPEDQ